MERMGCGALSSEVGAGGPSVKKMGRKGPE